MTSILIREEEPRDRAGVYAVEQRAFGRAAEADLVDQLREHGKASLSLVALEGEQVVGHVLFSPARIDSPAGSVPVQGLGPLAVLPERQGQGIGSALVRAGLQRLRQAGHAAVIVEGNPRYYTRFGFTDATPLGITCQFNPPPGCFMVQALQPGALRGVSGSAYYADEFQAVG
jgi:putative acetyltransferase